MNELYGGSFQGILEENPRRFPRGIKFRCIYSRNFWRNCYKASCGNSQKTNFVKKSEKTAEILNETSEQISKLFIL